MAQTNINVRTDAQLKQDAEAVFENLGMNMSTAINVFLKQVVQTNGIPFPLQVDPFYSSINQANLRKSLEQLDSGQVVHKTIEELEAMENE